MSDPGRQQVRHDAGIRAGANTAQPSAYSEAVNRYLGAFGYVDRMPDRSDVEVSTALAASTVDPGRHTVVVGVDESPASSIAVDHAAIEAELRGWNLRLILIQAAVHHQSAQRDQGAALLTHLVDRVHAGSRTVAAVSRLLVGSPAPLLLDEVLDAGLVVVGSEHGRISDAVGSSVGAYIAAHHRGPVMVVRMPAWPPGPGFATRPVVVGVDGACEGAVAFGVEEARLRGCDLVLLRAAGDAAGQEYDFLPAVRLAADADVTVHRRTVPGTARAALTEASLHATAVVVGSRGHSGLPGLLLGSVGQRLIREAHCPVFIVH